MNLISISRFVHQTWRSSDWFLRFAWKTIIIRIIEWITESHGTTVRRYDGTSKSRGRRAGEKEEARHRHKDWEFVYSVRTLERKRDAAVISGSISTHYWIIMVFRLSSYPSKLHIGRQLGGNVLINVFIINCAFNYMCVCVCVFICFSICVDNIKFGENFPGSHLRLSKHFTTPQLIKWLDCS